MTATRLRKIVTAGRRGLNNRQRHVRYVLERRGAELIAAYEAGATLATVAAEAGISSSALWNYLAAEGVPCRPRGSSKARARLDAMKAELIAAYEGGATVAALAARAGVCEDSVRSFLVAEGVARRRSTPRQLRQLAVDSAELIAAYEDGATIAALAARAGVSNSTLRARLVAEGVALRRYTAKPPMRLDGAAELIAAYEAGATTADLAARAGVCAPTIRKFLKAEGVALRDDRGRNLKRRDACG